MGKEFTPAECRRIAKIARRSSSYEAARVILQTERIKVSVSGIKKILARRGTHDRYETRSRTGRPRITNRHVDTLIIQTALTNRQMPITRVSQQLENQLNQTFGRHLVGRRLKEKGYHRCRAVKRPAASNENIVNRLNFATNHLNRPDIFWHRILFSDEKIFATGNDSKVILVTRNPSEKYHPDCMPPVKHWGIQVHVWGIIGWDGVGPLRRVEGNLTGERYREEIIYDIDELCTRHRNTASNISFFSRTMLEHMLPLTPTCFS